MSDTSDNSRIPDDLARRWSISSAFLIADTPSSLVYRVTLESGAAAILKSLKPRGLGERPGIAYLHWRGGNGAVRLLAQAETVCLIEDAGDTTLRTHRLAHGETASNTIILDVLAKLHAPGNRIPKGLTSLDRHFKALFARADIEADMRIKDALRFSAHLTSTLLADQSDIKALHGDLHHDNIISGESRGWLAIDPQGLVGDPAYDVANIFGNPIGALPDIIDPYRIRSLARIFAGALGCTEDKVLRYAIAHAGLSICWSLEDDVTLDDSKNARERLAFIDVARSLL
ncbi:aminoglycoside phosphotransferase family protein [Rhizobium skierniewicense]|uniref:aminoglycoside phosphotransferase family protein n=1 Tax=Rhizobium skierniewicense TaxID=984260 RepID=UPI001574CA6E|nr:aminoglycoside phosphotransferase family protein [Rhizobium skierniewicense]NTF31550.1 phosphotransferase [Rhizobium skierniewicense]